MKKLALAFLFCGASMFAATVTYGTTATFTGSDATNGGANLANGSAILSFTQIPVGSSVGAPTNLSLGYITVNNGSGSFSGLAPFNDAIAITINQTVPTNGSQVISSVVTGTISGTINAASDNIVLTFSPSSFNIGTASYTLQTVYDLVAVNTNGGVTSLQASVAVSPEPASLGLIGASLAALGLVYRRRAVK